MIQHPVTEHHLSPDVKRFVQGLVLLLPTLVFDLSWVEESLRDFYMRLTFYYLRKAVESPRDLLDAWLLQILTLEPAFGNSGDQSDNDFGGVDDVLH